MEGNYFILFVAALVPMVIGAVWYHPKVLGTAWMDSAGLRMEDLEGGNMPVIMGVSYLLAVVVSLLLSTFVIHQTDVISLFAMDPDFGVEGSETQNFFNSIWERIGDKHRTFGHGALHGGSVGLLFVTPIIAIKAMFERKGFKYIAINGLYWVITLALMGGIINHWF